MNREKIINRALTPKEADAIYRVISNPKLRRSFDIALYTGMTYKELQAFSKHPEWHNNYRCNVFLPKDAAKNKKERYIHLTRDFNNRLKEYIQDKIYFPDRRTWYDNIRRWAKKAGIKDWQNINAKTTRKTWESWLLEAGYNSEKIYLSMGYKIPIKYIHNFYTSFTPQDIQAIKQKTSDWMG